jgi:putrescine aminotransferase
MTTIAPRTTDRDAVLERYRAHVSRGRASLAQLMAAGIETYSEGVFVYDHDGERHLDCGGYGVFILGHRHPRVVAAVKQQIDCHPLATRELLEPRLAEAAEALATVSPDGLEYVFFASAGTEATEAALKLARLNGRTTLVSAECSFHGKTFGALSVTGREVYRKPFEPLVPAVEHIPFGDAGALRDVLARHDRRDCAVVLEPVQAEGGVRIPPPGYLREAKALCDEFDALLILDEIQTGLGRLGAWWGADREGVSPDMLLVGKALSGGVVPVSAVVATAEAFDELSRDPLLHTTTFSGAPIAMAAALAAVRAIDDEDVVERATALGERLLTVTRDALADHGSIVADVRGVGLLVGIEFREQHFAGDFTLELLRRRVIAAHSLNSNCVVRLTPPVSLGDEEIDWLVEAVGESAAAVAKRYGAAEND